MIEWRLGTVTWSCSSSTPCKQLSHGWTSYSLLQPRLIASRKIQEFFVVLRYYMSDFLAATALMVATSQVTHPSVQEERERTCRDTIVPACTICGSNTQ